MPTVDPDPAGLGTYLVAAVLLAWGIAIFLHILIREARAKRGQEQDGREASLKLELRRVNPTESQNNVVRAKRLDRHGGVL